MSAGAVDDPDPASIRRATPSDVTALVGVLARAFDDDRFYNWLLPQDSPAPGLHLPAEPE